MKNQAKRSKAMERPDELDRLSNLPNSILIEIFSFLDSKQAVQSCVLSKQWLKFWTLLPDLDFDSHHFRKLSSFDEFVKKVLTHRDTSVPIRGIKFSRGGSCTVLAKKIVKFAVSHRVKHLAISKRLLKLSYSCDSLRTMKLKRVQLEHSLCLKQLVSLHLSHVTLSSCENFSGCPNLEELTLDYWFSDEMLYIVAPQLSRLYLKGYGSRHSKVVLSTPKLTFLKIVEKICCVSQPDGLPLLEAIEINLHYTYGLYEEKDRLKLVSMLKSFFNVKRMRLSYRVIQILSELLNISAQEPSPFCNMEVLNIIPSPSWRCKSVTIPVQVITYLLGNSPHAKIVVEEER